MLVWYIYIWIYWLRGSWTSASLYLAFGDCLVRELGAAIDSRKSSEKQIGITSWVNASWWGGENICSKKSYYMGKGKGGHTCIKTYTRDEGSSGGEVYTQTNTQTHIQKHTQTHLQTHTQTHTHFFSSFGAYTYIFGLSGQVGNWVQWQSKWLKIEKRSRG